MEDKLVNYDEAVKEIEEYTEQMSTPFWKANIGEHKVKLLSEMRYWTYTDKETEKEEKRAKIDIKVNNEKFVWAMGIGKTNASAYGQLSALGKKHNGLSGREVIVYVKNKGKKNDYTIIDSAESKKADEETSENLTEMKISE